MMLSRHARAYLSESFATAATATRCAPPASARRVQRLLRRVPARYAVRDVYVMRDARDMMKTQPSKDIMMVAMMAAYMREVARERERLCRAAARLQRGQAVENKRWEEG